ncbi:MAG: PAS domain S-box protein [Gammaproteobacteria bacterium]|nr:PAS domain S-box protein [Gammaproteobacteria bacterium]
MHRLLSRQLKRTLGISSEQELKEFSLLLQQQLENQLLPEPIHNLCQQFIPLIDKVDKAYIQHQRDLDLRNLSLTLSSDELTQANEKIREDADKKSRIITTLRDATNELLISAGMDKISEKDTSLEKLSILMASLLRDKQKAQHQLEQQKFALDQHAIVSITNNKGKIIYANDSFCDISGYSKEELIGNTHKLVNSNYHNREFFKNMWTTITSGNVWNGEVRNRTKNGNYYWIAATIVPIVGVDGLAESYIAIRTDITVQKENEKKLFTAKQQAEAANQSKNQFIANMSHEIRTPMNAIIGLTYLTLETALDDKQQSNLEKILDAADNLLKIIESIFDFSKIESGELKNKSAPFNLQDELNKLLVRLNTRCEEKGLKLNLLCNTDKTAFFIGDPILLSKVLNNLTDNAVKFTNSGEVTISVQISDLKESTCKLTFSVQDTGIGMEQNQISHLFEPFSQADASTTRQYEGIGIGLSISKCLVKLMGGDLLVESQEGVGSTFSFTLTLGFSMHNNDSINDEIIDTDKSSKRAVKSLEQTIEQVEITAEKILPIISELETHIDSGNYNAVKLSQKLTKLVQNSKFHSLAKSINLHIEKFDFEKAQVSLNKLINEIKNN